VDASFAVHPDFKSHTGGVLTMGEGTLQGVTSKQKLNTRSSTEAELVGCRSRAMNIRYFFVNDQVNKGHLNVEYCPTKAMWADPMTKPLQGSDFKRSADRLMGRAR